MQVNRIMWGIVLLFIGGVLLLENFNIIEFYWSNVWRFWPIFLIIAGVNILFNKSKSQGGKSQAGGILSLVILVITLMLLFYKGQQPRHQYVVSDHIEEQKPPRDDHFRDMNFVYPYTDSTAKKTILNISGGGTSFELKGTTDSLIEARIERTRGNFSLETVKSDSIETLNFKMKGKSKWSMREGGVDVDFFLNSHPNWDVNVEMGAGKLDFDLSAYKVRNFTFDAGAAAMEVKFGDLLPLTDVNIKTGMADVKLAVPTTSGCRINTNTGLSAKDFTGFTKLQDGSYETPNFAGSAKKIFINLDGGLSNFEVKRY